MESKDFINGLLLGAIAGVTAGILLAPDKGTETWKKLSNSVKDKFDQIKSEAEDLANHTKNKAADLADEGTDKAKEIWSDGKNKAAELKQKADNTFS